jgi:hypothetical protein
MQVRPFDASGRARVLEVLHVRLSSVRLVRLTSRESVHIQFVSQVLPPSEENACSQRGKAAELTQV